MSPAITLTARSGQTAAPLTVTTDKAAWLPIVGNQNLGCYHGVGELRKRGYDVSPLRGHGCVFEMK